MAERMGDAAPPVARPAPAQPAMSRDSKGGYRPALDGIRAVAVLAVIAYHYNYRWAPGGFLGVDVFFVLSGYLITSLLLGEHARSSRIDLITFWFRRARRLFPALLVMLVGVSVWIALTASPFEMPMRRDDLFWTLFYGSNWHFIASGQDYFAQYASASPLRHTWSLAIEEQFYLFWPLAVGGALWIGRGRTRVLTAVCVVGIIASAAAMALLFNRSDPSRAYYGTDARMNQLLIGALLAVLLRGRTLSGRFGDAAAFIAPLAAVVLLVAFATVRDQGAAYYRGLSVALACTTAVLVWAVEQRPHQPVARVLSLAPVAWIGQLSYGLYLWHWPVILMITTAPPALAGLPGASTGLNLTRLAVTFVLVIVSYYVVEQPIRRGRMPVIGPSVRRFAVATVAAIVAVSGTIVLATSAATPAQAGTPIPDCPQFTICVRHRGPTGAPVLAVVGDSIARSLDPAFLAIARQRNWTYVLQANNSCRVTRLLSASGDGKNGALYQECFDKTPALRARLLAQWNPTIIVMADLMETGNLVDGHGRVLKGDDDAAIAASEEATTAVARELTGRGAALALLKLPPSISLDCLRQDQSSRAKCAVPVAATGDGARARYAAMYDRVASTMPRVSTLSVTPILCPNQVCVPIVANIVPRYDGEHFTAEGATLVTPTIDAQLQLARGDGS